jgi:hypothetical protein
MIQQPRRCDIHPMRRPIRDQRLDGLESDFRPLLISCLRQCLNGRWGLFGQNHSFDEVKNFDWEDGQYLKEAARQIRELRADFGQLNPLVERFLHYCSLRGPNVPGEPKLAKAFLDEIEKGDFDRS